MRSLFSYGYGFGGARRIITPSAFLYEDDFVNTDPTAIGAHTSNSGHTYTQNDWNGVLEIVPGALGEGIFVQNPQNIGSAPNGVIDGITYATGDELHMLIKAATTSNTQSMAGFIFNQNGSTTTQDFKFAGYVFNTGIGTQHRHMNIINGGFSGVTDALFTVTGTITELMLVMLAGNKANMYFDGDLKVPNIDLAPAGIAANGKVGITYQKNGVSSVQIEPVRAWIVRAA